VRLAHLDCIVSCTSHRVHPKRGAPNVHQVRVLHQPAHQELVNPDHVRTATEADSHKTVRLVIGEVAEEVEGDLKSVWETLTGEKAAL
jgi:hypothetical protein